MRLLKSLGIWLILFCSTLSLSAQTLYEFQYEDAKGQSYLGFMVYFNESDAYMRVAFTDNNGEYNVVNVDYTAVTGRDGDNNYCVFLGSNAKFIVGNQRNNYKPDTFVWLWGDDNVYDLPYRTDDPDFAPETFIQVKSYTELSVSTLTEEYIHQFYYTDEADYLAFLDMINDGNQTYNNTTYNYDSFGNSNNNNSNNYNSNNNNSNNNQNVSNNNSGKATFHFIVVANTEIGDIGKSCDVDKRNYLSEFEGVSEALGVTFQPYVIDGKNFTKKKVEETIKTMSVGADDIIFFVYTGHGFRWSDQVDKFPSLDLRYNVYQKISNETSIGLAEINDKIKAKGARLTIVFGDCCNSDVGINQRTSSTFLASRSNPNFKQEKLEKLFLKSKGNILATAASPGEVSWSNDVNGGFFTASFLSAFHEEISYLSNDVADWDGLINKTIKNAKYKSSPSTCSVCTAQNGQVKNTVSYK